MNSLSSLTNLLPVTLSKKRLRLVPATMAGVHQGDYESDRSDPLHHDLSQSTLGYAENDVEQRSFEVEVVNGSDRLSSFQLELRVNGQTVNAANRWYEVEPEVCSKCPPGDRTQFHVVINRAPLPTVNTTLDLFVHIFSVEYDTLETVEQLTLKIEPHKQQFQLHLVSRHLKVFPGDRLSIAALALNFHDSPAEVTVKLLGLDSTWFDHTNTSFKDGDPAVDCTLPGEDSQRIVFPCMPPKNPLTTSQIYPFDVEISDRNDYRTVSGTIEVLPMGLVLFKADSKRRVIPGPLQTLVKQGLNQTTFTLEFENQSNLSQQIHIEATETHHRACRIKPIPAFTLAPAHPAHPMLTGEVDAPSASTVSRPLEVRRERPLLGWDRRLFIEVTPTLDYAPSGDVIDQIQLKPSTQVLGVRVRPVVPLWLQLLVAFLALGLGGWLWWLRPQAKHDAPISSVHIISNKRQALSGGRDQALHHWDVLPLPPWWARGLHLRHLDIIAGSAAKHQSADDIPLLQGAIRTIEERPRRESQVAIGLENGHIELLNINSDQRGRTLTKDTDRVFALAFSEDGKYLFSGHGSGTVRRWDLEAPPKNSLAPLPKEMSVESVRSLAMVNIQGHDFVAIAGQNNSLTVWNGFGDHAYQIPYQLQPEPALAIPPVFTKDNALTSVVSADDNTTLATADDRGFITLWNTQAIEQCMDPAIKTFSAHQPQSSSLDSQFSVLPHQDSEDTPLIPLDCDNSLIFRQWQATPDGRAIRAIDLTEDGQHLVSVADTGEIILWPLTKTEDAGTAIAYERFISDQTDEPKSVLIDRFSSYAPQSVDIQKSKKHLIIAVDGPHNRIRLYQHRASPPTPSSPSDS